LLNDPQRPHGSYGGVWGLAVSHNKDPGDGSSEAAHATSLLQLWEPIAIITLLNLADAARLVSMLQARYLFTI
jgi:hypothetical protein